MSNPVKLSALKQGDVVLIHQKDKKVENPLYFLCLKDGGFSSNKVAYFLGLGGDYECFKVAEIKDQLFEVIDHTFKFSKPTNLASYPSLHPSVIKPGSIVTYCIDNTKTENYYLIGYSNEIQSKVLIRVFMEHSRTHDALYLSDLKDIWRFKQIEGELLIEP